MEIRIHDIKKYMRKYNLQIKSAFLIAVFILASTLWASQSGLVNQLSKLFYWFDDGQVAGEYTVRIAQVSEPTWASLQLELRTDYENYIGHMIQVQGSNGSFADNTMFFADDEFETTYWLPAYYYLSGNDTNLYEMYRHQMQRYINDFIDGDGYWLNPTYDTEHTLEAMTTLGNLALMDPSNSWTADNLYNLVKNLDNGGNSQWFVGSTNHLNSTYLATNGPRTSCDDGGDWSSNLKFADMAIAYATAYNDSRFETWARNYLDGWQQSMDRNNNENNYYVIPARVTSNDGSLGGCGDGWWEFNGSNFNSSWEDGFGQLRNMKTAFPSFYLATMEQTYLDAMKNMINGQHGLWELGGNGPCPASIYNADADSWSARGDCDEDHLFRLAMQIAIIDGVEDDLDSRVDTWANQAGLDDSDSQLKWLWFFHRNPADTTPIENLLQHGVDKMDTVLGRFGGLNNHQDLITYLDNRENSCVKKRCHDRDNHNFTSSRCDTDTDCSSGLYCDTQEKWRGDSLRYCFGTEAAATAVMASAFGGIRPTESELPQMEVKYFKSDGSLGLPQNVAALLTVSNNTERRVKLYNADTDNPHSLSIQVNYVALEETDAQIVAENGAPLSPTTPLTITNNQAYVEIPPQTEYEVLININTNIIQPTCDDAICDVNFDCNNCATYGTGYGDCAEADCSGQPPTCNNDGVCGSGEDNTNCPNDCYCGNNSCDPGEDEINCSDDCQNNAGFEWCNDDNTLCRMGEGRNPAIVMDSTGVIHMSYDCNCRGSTNPYPKYDDVQCNNICYRTWSCDNGVSAEQQIGEGWNSRITVDNNDLPHVVWNIRGTSGWDAIGYNKQTASGSWQYGEAGTSLIEREPNGRIDKPRIEINSNNHVYVSFADFIGGNNQKIAYVDFSADGSLVDLPFSSQADAHTVETHSALSNGGLAIQANDIVHFLWTQFGDQGGIYSNRMDDHGTLDTPNLLYDQSSSNFSDIAAAPDGDDIYGAGERGWGAGLIYMHGNGMLDSGQTDTFLNNDLNSENEVGPQHIDGDYLQTDITIDALGTPYIVWTGFGTDRMVSYCDTDAGSGTSWEIRNSCSDCPDSCDEIRYPLAYYVNAKENLENAIQLSPSLSSHSRQGSKWTNPLAAAARNQGIIVAFEYAEEPFDDPYSVYFQMVDGANICGEPPVEPTEDYKSDANIDNIVDIYDFGILMSCWDTAYIPSDPAACAANANPPVCRDPDTTGDDITDVDDLGVMLSCWGTNDEPNCLATEPPLPGCGGGGGGGTTCTPDGCNAVCAAGCDAAADPDCGTGGCCGDNVCDAGEDNASCPGDCPLDGGGSVCGNGALDGTEECDPGPPEVWAGTPVDNAFCQADCTWACITGYHREGDVCIENPTQANCGNPVTQTQLDNRVDKTSLIRPDPFVDAVDPDPESGYCSNQFGVWVYQLTDQEVTGASTYIENSERTNFNSTDEYFYAASNGWLQLYDNSGNLVHDFQSEIISGDVRMSKTQPTRFLYKHDNSLEWCDYSEYVNGAANPNLNCSTIMSVSGDWAGGDGNDITNDDRYLLLGGGGGGLYVYDLQNAKEEMHTGLGPCDDLDYATMSALGGYLVSYCRNPRATFIMPRTGGSWEELLPQDNHSEVSVDENGDEVIFMSINSSSDANGFSNYPGESYAFQSFDLLMINLRTKQARTLMNVKPNPAYSYVGQSMSVPIGNPSLLFIDAQKATSEDDISDATDLWNAWRVYEDEILEIPTTASERGNIRRLVHVYSSQLGGADKMSAQADLGVNNAGTQVTFRSAINDDLDDLYMFYVPPRDAVVEADPVVDEFAVTPGSADISWTVKSNGGSYLQRVEIYRAAYATLGCNENDKSLCQWQELPDLRVDLSGQNLDQQSDTAIDYPTDGTWWYGLHVIDSDNNVGYEPADPGPLPVSQPNNPNCDSALGNGDCSNDNPKLCYNGTLIDACGQCGCPGDLFCQSDGTCGDTQPIGSCNDNQCQKTVDCDCGNYGDCGATACQTSTLY